MFLFAVTKRVMLTRQTRARGWRRVARQQLQGVSCLLVLTGRRMRSAPTGPREGGHSTRTGWNGTALSGVFSQAPEPQKSGTALSLYTDHHDSIRKIGHSLEAMEQAVMHKRDDA